MIYYVNYFISFPCYLICRILEMANVTVSVLGGNMAELSLLLADIP